MGKIKFTNQADALALEKSIHQRMIANDKEYRDSANAGHTVRWCEPTQDVDVQGVVIPSSPWSVAITDWCWPVLTAAEQALVVP